ncbi:retrotransposon protein, putative, ty1-copia subclass [Tanacetum coccineum]
MGYAPNNASFAPKPKTPPPPKKDNHAKDAICHQCGEIGHCRRNCPVYLAELMKKKKLSQGASTLGIFSIELYSFPSKSWIYDTGCGTHICITTEGLRGSKKLKPGALSLYVGDGHRAAIEAIGTYHLELPIGLVIVLNNCHYAPSITRGVISVSHLFDDGSINRFDENNVISVLKNNLVYFMAVPRDGIFEIDIQEMIKEVDNMIGFSVLLNIQGIFSIELYSFPSKSWIYDTGCGTHICITTEGLRGSKKLKPGALSLYVGDGHRAAIEAIGTYHLELPIGLVIVLNNCHYAPSITRVPRDGIFEIDMSCSNTNDSSMYAITNKRAKINLDSSLLWQCRLGHISKKRIKKLQHDGLLNSIDIKSLGKCVSCLSSKMARKPYSHQVEREHRIIAHRTPPYTAQHNGVSERRNQTLLDMVRSMMSQTTLPKSYWDYALETVARILNMVPTKKVDKKPYEIWHGQAPKLSYLKVWGCEALVKLDTLTKPENLILDLLSVSL